MTMWVILQSVFQDNLVLFLTLIAATSIVLLVNLQRRRTYCTRDTPPGSLGWPFIGESLDYLRSMKNGRPEDFINKRVCEYGQVFKTSLMGSPTVVFAGTEANKFFFTNDNKLFAMSWPKSVANLFQHSLLNMSGQEAKKARRALMSLLGQENLQGIVKRVDAITKSHFAKHWISKEQVKVLSLVRQFTFSVSCNIFLKIEDENEQLVLLPGFEHLLKGMLQLFPLNVPGTSYHKALRGRDALLKTAQDLIDQQKNDPLKFSPQHQDLLAFLSSGLLLEDEIKFNLVLLMTASHDTTSCTLTALVKYLAENPSCYDKIFQEQMEIASSQKEDEALEWKDLQEMRYTWSAIQETLRLHPPALGGFREVIQDFTYQGFRIPKGWKAYYSAYSTQKSEEYFEDAERFDPERFQGEGPALHAMVPFGGGARMCPGVDFGRIEMLVFIHYLVKTFRWELIDLYERFIVDAVPIPSKGLPIKLKPHKGMMQS